METIIWEITAILLEVMIAYLLFSLLIGGILVWVYYPTLRKDAWNEVYRNNERLREKMKQGEISPMHYVVEREEYTEGSVRRGMVLILIGSPVFTPYILHFIFLLTVVTLYYGRLTVNLDELNNTEGYKEYCVTLKPRRNVPVTQTRLCAEKEEEARKIVRYLYPDYRPGEVRLVGVYKGSD